MELDDSLSSSRVAAHETLTLGSSNARPRTLDINCGWHDFDCRAVGWSFSGTLYSAAGIHAGTRITSWAPLGARDPRDAACCAGRCCPRTGVDGRLPQSA